MKEFKDNDYLDLEINNQEYKNKIKKETSTAEWVISILVLFFLPSLLEFAISTYIMIFRKPTEFIFNSWILTIPLFSPIVYSILTALIAKKRDKKRVFTIISIALVFLYTIVFLFMTFACSRIASTWSEK